jgi:O-antigen ligase
MPLYVIFAMESRDSMLGTVVTFAIVICYRLRDVGWRRARPFVAAGMLGAPVLCVVLYAFGFDVFQHISDTFESVTMMNDEHRGVDSGGSGRTDLWAAALHQWMLHPIFGVGFKDLEDLMPDHLPSHNAYIQILAETGAVGLFSYLLIVIVALVRTFWRGERVLSVFPQRIAILVSYVIYGLLESRAFSFGNTYSLLFFLVAFDSAKFRLKPSQKWEARRPAALPVQPGVPAPTELTLRSKD